MKCLYINLRPSWGFALRFQPQSKMRGALKFPPPTSVIGALSYPLLRLRGDRVEVFRTERRWISSSDRLRSLINHVSISVSGPAVIYGSFLKINQVYRGEVRSGVTALPATFIYSESEPFIELLYFLRRGIEEDINELLRAAFGITRLGSRESIMSAEQANIVEYTQKESYSVRTRFSFPYIEGLDVSGCYEILNVVDWKKSEIGDYSDAPRILMCYPRTEVEVKADRPFKIYEVDLPTGTAKVIAG